MTTLTINKTESKISAKNTQTCAYALVETLQELNVDTIFGYPGAAVLSIYNELSLCKNIRHILVRQ